MKNTCWLAFIFILAASNLSSVGAASTKTEALRAQAETNSAAQFRLAVLHFSGRDVPRDYVRARELFDLAAQDSNLPEAKYNLAVMYARGLGTEADLEQARILLDEAEKVAIQRQKFATAKRAKEALAKVQPPVQEKPLPSRPETAEHREASPPPSVPKTKPSAPANPDGPTPDPEAYASNDYPVPLLPPGAEPQAFGSGFFITEDGFFITNQHVTYGSRMLAIRVGQKTLQAALVSEDPRNDLALLKVQGKFRALPLMRESANAAQRVFTYGFPDPGVQGINPKFTDGSISSVSGLQDDPTQYQITVPLQGGNSGGPLVDFYGNVVGVVVARKRDKAKIGLDARGQIAFDIQTAQNVNYAVKSKMIFSLVDTVKGLVPKLRKARPTSSERKLEEIASEVEHAIGMVINFTPTH